MRIAASDSVGSDPVYQKWLESFDPRLIVGPVDAGRGSWGCVVDRGEGLLKSQDIGVNWERKSIWCHRSLVNGNIVLLIGCP